MNSMANPQEGWYPDPQSDTQVRWWDGESWTEHVEPYAEIPDEQATTQADPVWEETAEPVTAEPVVDDATRATPVASLPESTVGRAGGLGISSHTAGTNSLNNGVSRSIEPGFTADRSVASDPGVGAANAGDEPSSVHETEHGMSQGEDPSVTSNRGGVDGVGSDSTNSSDRAAMTASSVPPAAAETPATMAMSHTPLESTQHTPTDPGDAPTQPVALPNTPQSGAAGQHSGSAWQQEPTQPSTQSGSVFGPELKGTWSDDEEDVVGGHPGQHSWQGRVGAGDQGFARTDFPDQGLPQREDHNHYPVGAEPAHSHHLHESSPQHQQPDSDLTERNAQDEARGYRVVGDDAPGEADLNQSAHQTRPGTVYGTPAIASSASAYRDGEHTHHQGEPSSGDGVWGETAYPDQFQDHLNSSDAATSTIQVPPGAAPPGATESQVWGDRVGPFRQHLTDPVSDGADSAATVGPADAAISGGDTLAAPNAAASDAVAGEDGEQQRQRMAEQTRNARLRELDASADRFEAEAQTAMYELNLLNEENVQEESTLAEAIRLASSERMASESDVRAAEAALRETREAVSDLSAKVDAAQAKVEQAQVSSADAARREQAVVNRAEDLLKQAELRRQEALARVEQTADVAKRARAAARAAAAGDYVPEPEAWRREVLATSSAATAGVAAAQTATPAGSVVGDDTSADAHTATASAAGGQPPAIDSDSGVEPGAGHRLAGAHAAGDANQDLTEPTNAQQVGSPREESVSGLPTEPTRPQPESYTEALRQAETVTTPMAVVSAPAGPGQGTEQAGVEAALQAPTDVDGAAPTQPVDPVQGSPLGGDPVGQTATAGSGGGADPLSVDTVASVAATPAGIDAADYAPQNSDRSGSAPTPALPVVAPGAGAFQPIDAQVPALAPHDASTVDTGESYLTGQGPDGVGAATVDGAARDHTDGPTAVWAVASAAADTENSVVEQSPQSVLPADGEPQGRLAVGRQPDEVDAAARVVVEHDEDPFGGPGGGAPFSGRRPDGGSPMTAALDGIGHGSSGSGGEQVADVRHAAPPTTQYSGGGEPPLAPGEPTANLDSGALGLPIRSGPRGEVAWEDDESPESAGVMTVARAEPAPEPPVRPTQPVPRRSAGGLSVALPRDPSEPAEPAESDEATLNVVLPDTDAARQAALDGLTVGQLDVAPTHAVDYPANADPTMSPTAAQWLQEQPEDLHAAVVGASAVAGEDYPAAEGGMSAVKRPGETTKPYRLGSRMLRLVAYVLDSALIAGMLGALSFPVLEPLLAVLGRFTGSGNPLAQMAAEESMALGVFLAGACLIPALYETLLVRFNRGSTVGHMLVGLRVAPRDDAGTVRLGDAFARWFMKYPIASLLSVVGVFNFAWCLWDADRQCWHDKAAGTTVIKRSDT